jgi:quercetin dioxygenase-like cupin family protein
MSDRVTASGYHVQRAREVELAPAAGLEAHVSGLRRATLVGRQVGSVHTGFALVELEPGGAVNEHLHSTEQSFYVLRGQPCLTVAGRTHRLGPNDCGLLPVGVPHAWAASSDATAAAACWTGSRPAADEPGALDIRDPRTRTFFRLGAGEMDVDNLKLGAPVDAPTVSASMATALLAYSGIAVKMLVDQRLGAVLHTMFMVEYQPGGAAQPHDHPFEETYYLLDGEVEAMADDQVFALGPGDVFWTGVGCVHAFFNRSDSRVRWLETQSPQPPTNYSYRFNRDWDYLADHL